MWRFLDLFFSSIGLLLLSPLFLLCAFLILVDDGAPVFYKQERIGRFGHPFRLIKFRTMYKDAYKRGLITVGGRDSRITQSGYWLRKLKLDELPQLLNVLKGDMSIVGPRPEVEKYVELYPAEYNYLLTVRPGISSPASIAFSNENELLSQAADPEEHYRKVILPKKIELDRRCVEKRGVVEYISVIMGTLVKVVSGNK